MLCYGWGDCGCLNCQERSEHVSASARCKLLIGEQYMMSIDGVKIRVLLLSPDELDTTTNERRAHVIVLEDNPYVRAGAECRPLAYTMHLLK